MATLLSQTVQIDQVFALQVTVGSIPLDVRVSIQFEPKRPRAELDELLVHTTKTTLEDILNNKLSKTEFRVGSDCYVLDDTFSSKLQKNLGKHAAKISEAYVEIPYKRLRESFQGISMDAIDYIATAEIDYQPRDASIKPDRETIGLLSPDVRLAEDCKDSVRRTVNNYIRTFTEAWQHRTLGDYVETYNDRSQDEKDVLKWNKPYRYLNICDCGGITILTERCTIDVDIERQLLGSFRTRTIKAETCIFWLFFCLFGLCLGSAYKFLFKDAIRTMKINRRGLVRIEIAALRAIMVLVGFGASLLSWLVVLPLVEYVASDSGAVSCMLVKVLMALMIGPITILLP